ncbi:MULTISPECIES: ATP-grasp domain-containing protein [unclassified Streptomyces]|uniref:ATP-grasp domain-containing protein n=1 Tax=unclassified Streptomyces TaxID=2593676 RepID=UPI00381DEC30
MAHVVFVDSGPAYLPAFARAKELGHHVTFVRARDISMLQETSTSEERIAEALERVDQVVTLDELAAELESAIGRIHRARPVDALLTTSELAVLPTARAAESIGARGTPVRHLAQAARKDECRRRLHEAGIRSPRHATVTSAGQARLAARELGFPLVIKPSRGVAKEAAGIVRSDEELDAYFAGLKASRAVRSKALDAFIGADLLMESYLEGDLYSAEVVAHGGDPRLLMITRRERAVHNELFEVAALMPAGLPEERAADVERYMRDIFRELRLTVGVYHVEFIMTGDGPTLVEINSRMMGGSSPTIYQHVTRADPFEILIREHLGEPCAAPAPPFGRAGIVVVFGSVAGGVAPPDIERRVERIRDAYRPLRYAVGLRNGGPIRQMAGNFSALGYFCLSAATADEARARGLELLSDMEDACEVPLARYR